jgi:hypothetical protein
VRTAYEAGLAELHSPESVAADAGSLRQARATAETFEAEYARLHARREQLEAEVAALETV